LVPISAIFLPNDCFGLLCLGLSQYTRQESISKAWQIFSESNLPFQTSIEAIKLCAIINSVSTLFGVVRHQNRPAAVLLLLLLDMNAKRANKKL
jgi:hypothetical protein